jgi:uncharacterized protein
MATDFTPLASTIGGAMIGLSAVLLMAGHGKIAGISGIGARLFPPYQDSKLSERLVFIAGLAAAPFLISVLTGQIIAVEIATSPYMLVVAGVLAGFGSVLGGGCTSGHGICGMSRLSVRSFVAVAVFMVTAIITVFVVRHGMGG